MFTACRFRSLRDVNRDAVERWLSSDASLRRSARTKNTFLIAAKAFLTWCSETDRRIANPLSRLARADEKIDRRRVPRALTPDERQRLLNATQRRPLAEALKFDRGWRLGELAAVRICDLMFDGPRPCVVLGARHTKNRQDATLLLRSDLTRVGPEAALIRDSP
jgi:site-specific recombinase XerD